eukprot:gnl/MRDRNA2_/MRDRNA2_82793_c0_seq5.p1 gnl/MRDRNA2_/MRDRNA2_82793_c0~~gnl/MRDRNA2_/MRDRNA2_82793_c0_seq5.p1  ORF type:complete len:207 (+),score=20.30 gnl/MRDRNA2_/MRDRNA2_82793_c0_seq5:108-728(+)
MFACGVLASGQAASMTSTLAGQHLMAGFLGWHIPNFSRMLIVRSLALGPAVVVAALAQETPGLGDRLNVFLNVLQFVLLPFALLPILHFCSDRRIMGDRFVLKHSSQVLGWVMALSVTVINMYLMVQNAIGMAAWMWLAVFLFIVAYYSSQVLIIHNDLVKFWNIMVGRTNVTNAGNRSLSEQELHSVSGIVAYQESLLDCGYECS